MIRHLMLAAMFVAALAAPAGAVTLVETAEVASSTNTCAPIAISSMGANGGPTDIVVSTAASYRRLYLQNLEAAETIWHSERSDVSTTTTAGIKGAGVRGEKIKADSTSRAILVPPSSKWYAVCSTGTATCEATVCKER